MGGVVLPGASDPGSRSAQRGRGLVSRKAKVPTKETRSYRSTRAVSAIHLWMCTPSTLGSRRGAAFVLLVARASLVASNFS